MFDADTYIAVDFMIAQQRRTDLLRCPALVAIPPLNPAPPSPQPTSPPHSPTHPLPSLLRELILFRQHALVSVCLVVLYLELAYHLYIFCESKLYTPVHYNPLCLMQCGESPLQSSFWVCQCWGAQQPLT